MLSCWDWQRASGAGRAEEDAGSLRDGDSTGGGGAGFKSRLLAAKEARKEAEQDAQLLANRIALLKLEEERAMKKIEQTRKRAAEIAAMRAEQEERERERMRREEEALRDERQRTSKAPVSPEDRRRAASTTRRAVVSAHQHKLQGAKELKDEKLRMRTEMQRARMSEEARARQRSQQIREQEEAARRKREEERRRLAEARRAEYERKIADEEAARSATAARVGDLERLENELITRLRATQLLQQQAFESLEAILSGEGPATMTGGGGGGGGGVSRTPPRRGPGGPPRGAAAAVGGRASLGGSTRVTPLSSARAPVGVTRPHPLQRGPASATSASAVALPLPRGGSAALRTAGRSGVGAGRSGPMTSAASMATLATAGRSTPPRTPRSDAAISESKPPSGGGMGLDDHEHDPYHHHDDHGDDDDGDGGGLGGGVTVSVTSPA